MNDVLICKKDMETPVQVHSLKPFGSLISIYPDSKNVGKYLSAFTPEGSDKQMFVMCSSQTPIMYFHEAKVSINEEPTLRLYDAEGLVKKFSWETPDEICDIFQGPPGVVFALPRSFRGGNEGKLVRVALSKNKLKECSPWVIPSNLPNLTYSDQIHPNFICVCAAYSVQDGFLCVLRIRGDAENLLEIIAIAGDEVSIVWKRVIESGSSWKNVRAVCSETGKLFVASRYEKDIYVMSTKDGTFVETIITDEPVFDMSCNVEGNKVAAVEGKLVASSGTEQDIEFFDGKVWVYTRN